MRRLSFLVLALAIVFPALLSAAPKAKPKSKATEALLAAAAEGDEDAVVAAISQGADVTARDEKGNTALMLVSQYTLFGKEKEIADGLLKAKGQLDAKNDDGQTALMLAVKYDRWSMVKELISRGAKVDLKDSDGWTALMYAAINGSSMSTDSLLEAEASLDETSKAGASALLIALQYGRGGVAEKLVKAGAKFPTNKTDGLTPMLLSVFSHDLAAVRIALDPMREPDLNARDKDGWSALEIAAYNDDRQIAMELLRAGIDPSLKDSEGKNALDRAIERENVEMIALLGGKWDKPKLASGTNITIPCPVLGGNVVANIALDGTALNFTTLYPKPINWYLGGGLTNRASSAVKYTYQGSIDPAFYFDIDNNARTGMTSGSQERAAVGSEYSLEYMQYGTSVTYNYKDSDGNERSRPIYANVLSASVEKGGESVDTSEVSEDDRPYAINDNGVLRTRVPLSMIGLAPGKSMKVTAKIGGCGPVSTLVKLK
jgi:ankyrin repeat protein